MQHMKLIIIAFLLISGFSNAAEVVGTTYYHHDAMGSPIAATDDEGKLLWRESYYPYGERIQNDPKALNNARWFTGHPQDAESGLIYMGARYYDPRIGRFMAIDPVGFNTGNIQSFNRYAYANNNPYKYVDPDGEAAVLLWFATPQGIAALKTVYAVGAGLVGIVGGLAINETVIKPLMNEDGNDEGDTSKQRPDNVGNPVDTDEGLTIAQDKAKKPGSRPSIKNKNGDFEGMRRRPKQSKIGDRSKSKQNLKVDINKR